MTNKEEINKQTYTSARFYETAKVENMQSESITNKMNEHKGGKHMGHHKHCHAKHCKYEPTTLNMDKVLFPSKPQGIRAFCEGLRAFPIGHRHCR